VLDKAKSAPIKSLKSYFYGVLKKQPQLSELLTLADHEHLKKEKQKMLTEKIMAQVEQTTNRNKADNLNIKMAAKAFLAQLNHEKTLAIKQQFNGSIVSQ